MFIYCGIVGKKGKFSLYLFFIVKKEFFKDVDFKFIDDIVLQVGY